MNAKLLLLPILSALALLARAGEPATEFGGSTSSKAATGWNTDPKHWDQLLRERNDSPGLRIGKGGFAISPISATGRGEGLGQLILLGF
jgi:hypothetical protein